MQLKSHKDLIVWKKSIELVKNIYVLTAKLPTDETYGLSSQMRRAAISIPSNIAEGYSRKGTKEYLQFLHIAFGSSNELETQLIIAKDLYANIDYRATELLLEEVLKILNTIIATLKERKD